MDEQEIIGSLTRFRDMDFSYEGGKVLSSVSTKPLNVAIEAYRIFSEVNALDLHVFPSVALIEQEVIEWFGELFLNNNIEGYISPGGTESNIAALWAARKKYPGKDRIIVAESAHYSISKAADILGLEIDWVGLDDSFRADVGEVERLIGPETLGVIAIAGTSALGVVDPLKEINALCSDIFFHIDAAFGGFVIPFLDTGLFCDFSLSNLDSMTVAPMPSGAILFRDNSYVRELSFRPTYLPVRTFTVCGSRSGGSIAATWATIKYLGMGGYRRIVRECMENTRYLVSELERIGVPPVVSPVLNFLAIKPDNIRNVFSELRSRGWNIILDEKTCTMRVVLMPHVTRRVIDGFINDLGSII